MASVDFAPEKERPALDQALEAAAVACTQNQKPIRIRLQPDLYEYERRIYAAWLGLTWIVEVGDLEEGRRLRQGLQDFFRLFGQSADSQDEMLRELRELVTAMSDTVD
jgi:hypothetical protein